MSEKGGDMVEFAIGKNIKTKSDKLVVVQKADAFAKYLNEGELHLLPALKKISLEDKIKAYNLGEYTLFAATAKELKTALDWSLFGGEAWKNMKNCREVKVSIECKEQEKLFDFALGVELASYRFDKYFTKKPGSFYPKLEKISFVGLKDMAGYKNTAGLANAVRYARDLISEPANELTPEIFAADIQRLSYLGLEVQILDEKQMKEQGFNLALSVAQGSCNSPRVGVIKWRGNKKQKEFTVGLVGKGVTFDSGGISIKPAANMWDMKQDMAGAAAMVAVMKSLALQQTDKNVVAVVGLVENMPSGSATRPGDIVRSMSGQTVEIQNTDAEGRLVLADCLTYIQREFKPEFVIDMATLTGAITIALGSTYAGLFSNSPRLAKDLGAAGEYTGERLWQLPLDKEYDKLMDSTVADMKNIGGRCAGSATAACFLQRFVNKETKWAHLDIAGVDLSDGSKVLYPKGASAFGVRLLNRFINKI